MKDFTGQSQLDQIRFKSLYDLLQMIDRPEQEILDFALEAGVTATNSEIGYIYFTSGDESKLYLHAWSKNVMPNCTIETYPDAYLVSETGLWGEAVRQRKPIITNDYTKSPYRRGYPEGHVPVRNHMNLPVFDNGKIVIIAGVGNKPGDYAREDIQQLSLIMDGMWHIVKRKRVEEELKETNENLEKTIHDRTIELHSANHALQQTVEKQHATQKTLTQSEALFRGVFDNASTPILMLTPNGRVKLANRVCAKRLGYSQKDLYKLKIDNIIHPDDLQDATLSFQSHLDQGDASWDNERRLLTRDGRTLWGHLNLTVLKDPQGNIDSFIIVATDITDRKLAEQALERSSAALAKSREQLRITIDNVPALISYVDKDLRYRFVNKQYERMYKIPSQKLVGAHVETVIGKKAFKKLKYRYDAVLKGAPQRFERDFSDQGKDLILDVAYIPHQHDGSVEGIFILIMDITERKKMEQHLKKLSVTDPLTGTKNRRFLMDHARKEIERSKRYHTDLSFVMIDIDHFKSINDDFGHDAGDVVLKQLVANAENIVRKSDIFSRIGGEEFAAVLLETDIKKAFVICERLRENLSRLLVRHNNKNIRFSVSIGVTPLNPDIDDNLEAMMKRADKALYQAKIKGRNQTVTLI